MGKDINLFLKTYFKLHLILLLVAEFLHSVSSTLLVLVIILNFTLCVRKMMEGKNISSSCWNLSSIETSKEQGKKLMHQRIFNNSVLPLFRYSPPHTFFFLAVTLQGEVSFPCFCNKTRTSKAQLEDY